MATEYFPDQSTLKVSQIACLWAQRPFDNSSTAPSAVAAREWGVQPLILRLACGRQDTSQSILPAANLCPFPPHLSGHTTGHTAMHQRQWPHQCGVDSTAVWAVWGMTTATTGKQGRSKDHNVAPGVPRPQLERVSGFCSCACESP